MGRGLIFGQPGARRGSTGGLPNPQLLDNTFEERELPAPLEPSDQGSQPVPDNKPKELPEVFVDKHQVGFNGPRYALFSVTDKTGIEEPARALAEQGVTILASGGTLTYLKKHGIDAIPVQEITKSEEYPDHLVVTINDKLAFGILGKRFNEVHKKASVERTVPKVDFVVCNLYKFAEKAEELAPDIRRAHRLLSDYQNLGTRMLLGHDAMDILSDEVDRAKAADTEGKIRYNSMSLCDSELFHELLLPDEVNDELVLETMEPIKEKANGAIDIGGVNLIRGSAKNAYHVAVIVDQRDYGLVAEQIRATGRLSPQTRDTLRAKAFAYVAAYDKAIAGFFNELMNFPNSMSEEVVPEHPGGHS